jgi:hypothetical protein
MQTDFGVLPYVLLTVFAVLVIHSSSERPWSFLSKTGLIAFIASFALNVGYGAEAVNREMALFIPVVIGFVIFAVCSVLVTLKEAVTLLHYASTNLQGK